MPYPLVIVAQSPQPFQIGRRNENQLIINSEKVSRYQCQIVYEPGQEQAFIL